MNTMTAAINVDLFAAFIIILIAVLVYAALKLRAVLREFGEIMARAGRHTEQADPDPGNPHEDTKANRDEDPR